MKVQSVIAALLAVAGLGLPAVAQPIPFAFSASVTEPALQHPETYSGTMTPFGPGTVVSNFPSFPNDDIPANGATVYVTFNLANGTSFTATSTWPNAQNLAFTITGGTGVFANATGTLQFSLDDQVPFVGSPDYILNMTGSGTIALSGEAGVTVHPSKIGLQSPLGSNAAVSSSLILNNAGLTAALFTASASVTSKSNWLSISATSGSIQGGATGSIQVTANPSGLKEAVYAGEINLGVNGALLVIPVSLIVGSDGGNLLLSETGASFKAVANGPAPAAQTIQVKNTGTGNLSGLTATTTVTVSAANWLQASIATGFASQTQTPVTVTVDPGSLAPGTYFGLVTFDLPSAPNSPQSVSVQMIVNPGPPPPTFKPAQVVLETTVNVTAQTPVWGPDPPPQTVLITNPGTENLSFTATVGSVIGFGDTWFTFSPTSGSLGPGQTTQINISVTPDCLETPSCAQSVGFDNASGNIVYLNVNFPAIKYTYALQTSFDADQVYDGNCPTSGPTCETYGGDLRPAPHRVVPKASTVVSCNLTFLRGVFTSLPPNFQATVGQPVPLEAQISNDCGDTLDSGTVVATFSSGDSAVVLNPLGAGQWAATWTPQNAAANDVIILQAGSPTGLFGALSLSGSVAASTSTPIIGAGGIVNAASGAPVIAPGAFIAIYGANMGGGVTTASKVPFPTSLGSTEVFLGGQSLPLFFTSAQQIDAIVPYDIAANSSQQLIVQTGDALSQPEPVTVAAAQPGVFTQNQSGSGPGAILGQKPGGVAALNTAANPASAGDALLIFCTGLGTVTPAVAAGSAASTTKLSNTDNPVTVTVGGDNAQVLFAGLAPGFVGLYQVNVIVPSGIAAASDVPVVLTAAGATSAPVTVAIK
jgi:uncharacterized protein (TIGR03437 family)